MINWEPVEKTNHEHYTIYGNFTQNPTCMFVVVGHDPKLGYFWNIPMFGKGGKDCPTKDAAKKEGLEKLKAILTIASANLETTVEQE